MTAGLDSSFIADLVTYVIAYGRHDDGSGLVPSSDYLCPVPWLIAASVTAVNR